MTFNNVHAWIPLVNPNEFRNRPVTLPGLYEAPAPTNAEPVVHIEMVSDTASYPNAKYFRTSVQPSQQTGRTWATNYAPAIADVIETLSELPWLRDRAGEAITDFALDPYVNYRQLSKRWYNRGAALRKAQRFGDD